METIFILTVSLLPCLVYLSVGIYVVLKMRGKWDGSDETTFKIQKDFAILFFVIALCYLSGCAYIVNDEDMAFSEVTGRIVMKLYVVSSFMPCVFVKRYVFKESSWFLFYVSAFFILALMLFTDAIALAGIYELSNDILLRGSVFLALFIFCFVVYVYCVHASMPVEDGRREQARGLVLQILAVSVYNFLVLLYSFGLHVVLDYFILVCGFAIVHGVLLMRCWNDSAVFGACSCVPDIPGEVASAAEDVALDVYAEDVLKDIVEDSSLSLKERLLNYFENEKPYLSKDLSMQEVAMRLFTNKSYLSKTINVEMNKNFRELVNYFRVREAMRIFSANTDISMSDLRNMCGFNNNASFTSAFKLNTGCTPGEWCRDMKNKLQEERRNSNEKH